MATTWREGSARATFTTGADFTSGGTVTQPTLQGVKLDSNGNIVACSAATDAMIGVITTNPIGGSGDTASVLLVNQQGTGKVASGAAISRGALLSMDSTGRAVTATQTSAGSQPTNWVFGRALTAASAAGQVVEYESMYFLY